MNALCNRCDEYEVSGDASNQSGFGDIYVAAVGGNTTQDVSDLVPQCKPNAAPLEVLEKQFGLPEEVAWCGGGVVVVAVGWVVVHVVVVMVMMVVVVASGVLTHSLTD